MKMSIGFLVSAPFFPSMESIKEELASYCDLRILAAEDNEKAQLLYQEHVGEVDCFIASGVLLYYAVKTRLPELGKPIYVLDDRRADLKDVFLKLLLADRGFKFSRVFVDFAAAQNDYLGIKEWLPKEEWPYFGEFDVREIESFDQVEELCRATRERHYELHRAGLVDLSLTRIGLLAKEFERDGIPYLYVYPGRDYIVNFVLQVVNAHNSKKTRDNALGAIALFFGREADASDAALASRANELLASYVVSHGYDFAIQKDDDRIFILTRRKDIVDLTKDFTDGGFKDYLEGAIGRRISLGLGTGNNFFQAKLHAVRAAEISRARDGRVFFISERDEPARPVGAGANPGLAVPPSTELFEWSRRLHLDRLSLQKIVAFARVSRSTRIAACELARHLGITSRSANRLLGKIEAHGGATSYTENLSGGRGRPRKRYALDLAGLVEDGKGD